MLLLLLLLLYFFRGYMWVSTLVTYNHAMTWRRFISVFERVYVCCRVVLVCGFEYLYRPLHEIVRWTSAGKQSPTIIILRLYYHVFGLRALGGAHLTVSKKRLSATLAISAAEHRPS